jgi:hypothetical protein
MKYFSTATLFAFLFSALPVCATEIVQKDEKWFDCEKSQECIWTTAPCYGPSAVNKKYKKKYERYVENQRTMIKCQRPPGESYMNASKDHVVCKNKKCVVDMPEFQRVP